jgi:Ca2+-dependent lipid-binding protein
MTQEVNKLKVKIIEAKNLDAKDFFSSATSDPYAVLSIITDKEKKQKEQFHRTKVQSKTLSPKWNETFTLQ